MYPTSMSSIALALYQKKKATSLTTTTKIVATIPLQIQVTNQFSFVSRMKAYATIVTTSSSIASSYAALLVGRTSACPNEL